MSYTVLSGMVLETIGNETRFNYDDVTTHHDEVVLILSLMSSLIFLNILLGSSA